MKGELNPPLKEGDRIILYHMEGEVAVEPGTMGTVVRITRDPFENNSKIVSVDWDNGSKLQMLTHSDAWKKVQPKKIDEQSRGAWNYMVENQDIFDNFDWRFLREFLYKIRNSGIINMVGASPLLYAGRDHIDRYYGEGREDDENFQEVLNNAEEAKNKIIQGVLKYMQSKNKDITDLGQVNRFASHFAAKILGLYIAMSEFRHD